MKQFFDDFTGTVLTSRGEVRFDNGVLINERTMEKENKTRGGARPNAGRKRQGEEAKRTTVSFVCTPSEKTKLKELAENAGLSQSQFICKKIFS